MHILLSVLSLVAGLGLTISTFVFACKHSCENTKTLKTIKICMVGFAILGIACLAATYCLFGWEGFLAAERCTCGCTCA